jgi:hypothetical protein
MSGWRFFGEEKFESNLLVFIVRDDGEFLICLHRDNCDQKKIMLIFDYEVRKCLSLVETFLKSFLGEAMKDIENRVPINELNILNESHKKKRVLEEK